MDRGGTILIFLVFIQGTCGQSVILSVDPVVERGEDTVFTCTGGTSPYAFVWTDTSVNPNVIIYTNGEKSPDPKYSDFTILENGDTSTMTIMNTRIEDEGPYSCSEGLVSDDAEFTVEVQATLSLSVGSPLRNGNMYNATCDAVNGRPEVTTSVTWMIGDDTLPCSSTVVEDLPADTDLFSKRSWCTFQALSEYNNKTLRCIVSNHQLTSLNGEETTTLNVESAPVSTGIMTVRFQFQDPNPGVSCVIADEDQPNPTIMNYYITSNNTLIHQSTMGVNFGDVAEPNFVTDFLCVAGNYLGNTTSEVATYDPDGPTTPSPTTEPITTEGPTTVPPTEDMMTSPGPNDGNETGGLSGTPTSPPPSTTDGEDTTGGPKPAGLSAGAIAGIAIGAVLLIVIIILIIYFVCIRGKDGSPAATSTKKHGSSAVGTSNGSEKNDVAAPLNSVNEVVTEDKIKPVAAPRDQGSIQHTTDNPGQAEYAMVDRKKPGGGDMPDTRGPGQKEPPQGMLYADLDLSASAGHTEKKVPQNKDDVVVYSSILV